MPAKDAHGKFAKGIADEVAPPVTILDAPPEPEVVPEPQPEPEKPRRRPAPTGRQVILVVGDGPNEKELDVEAVYMGGEVRADIVTLCRELYGEGVASLQTPGMFAVTEILNPPWEMDLRQVETEGIVRLTTPGPVPGGSLMNRPVVEVIR